MAGFEPRISRVGSDRSTNCIATTAQYTPTAYSSLYGKLKGVRTHDHQSSAHDDHSLTRVPISINSAGRPSGLVVKVMMHLL